jgi:DNA modification methylase
VIELDKIYCEDCLSTMARMPDNFVDCVVTSPPYWGLRDYKVRGQIGLEKTPEEFTTKMVEVFRAVRRILKPGGTCWINIGDSYASNSKNRRLKQATAASTLLGGLSSQASILKQQNKIVSGLKAKDLVGIPWRVALALQSDCWWLRQDIIWHKPNTMTESCTDRCTKSHEYIFLLTKSARYYYDAQAISEPCVIGHNGSRYDNERDLIIRPNVQRGPRKNDGSGTGSDGSKIRNHSHNSLSGETRNKRSVWTVCTKPFFGAHFATFPPELIEPMILAGTSEKGICPDCGRPWTRIVKKSGGTIGRGSWTCHDEKDAERGMSQNQAEAKKSMNDGTYRVRPAPAGKSPSRP